MNDAVNGAMSRPALYGQALQELKYLCGGGEDYKWRDAVINHVEALEADNARLRALVAKAQTSEGRGHVDESGCPWCNGEGWWKTRGGDRLGGPHDADCPAFTPDGTVK